MSNALRITQNMMSDRLLSDVRRSNASIAKTSNQVTSQQRIETAADDPTGARRALRLRSALDEVDSNRSGAATALGWTQSADSALSSVNDIVHRAHELVVEAGNDTLSASDRANVGKELGQLVEQLKSAANSKYGDSYVFAGQNATNPPYTAGASDAYAGDSGAVIRTIGPGQALQVNQTGDAIFGGTPGDGKLLDTMRSAIARLNGGTVADATALRTTVLAALNTNLNTVITARSTIGSAQARATLADSRLQDVKLTLTDQLSTVQDTDMAEAITSLTTQKTAYQAALQAGAKVIQTSLMDFLR